MCGNHINDNLHFDLGTNCEKKGTFMNKELFIIIVQSVHHSKAHIL